MRGRLSGPQARSLTPKASRPSKASGRLTYLRTAIEGFYPACLHRCARRRNALRYDRLPHHAQTFTASIRSLNRRRPPHVTSLVRQ